MNKYFFARDRVLEFERRKRVFMIYALSLIGSTVCVIFGLQNLSEGYTVVGYTVIITAVLTCVNLVYFFYKKRVAFATSVMGTILLMLGLFLIVSGGYRNTGLFWIYPIVAMAIFINNFRTGLIFSIIFVTLSLIILLFIPDSLSVSTQYSGVVKLRFLFTLIVLLILCLTLEFSLGKLRKQTLSLHNQLVLAANTDSLTQLPNRRYIFDNYIKTEETIGFVNQQSIMLCDVDHFKVINDTYGHEAGDAVLLEIATRLRNTIRSNDVIARWGGEEFLVLLPETPYSTALQRAEMLRQVICDKPVAFEGEEHNVTISIGVVTSTKGQSTKSLLNGADKQLYLAKNKGRNTVC